MTPEDLQHRLAGETALWLERNGDTPLDAHGLAVLAFAVLAMHAGTVAHAVESCRDGDGFTVNAWDCGKP